MEIRGKYLHAADLSSQDLDMMETRSGNGSRVKPPDGAPDTLPCYCYDYHFRRPKAGILGTGLGGASTRTVSCSKDNEIYLASIRPLRKYY